MVELFSKAFLDHIPNKECKHIHNVCLFIFLYFSVKKNFLLDSLIMSLADITI